MSSGAVHDKLVVIWETKENPKMKEGGEMKRPRHGVERSGGGEADNGVEWSGMESLSSDAGEKYCTVT